MKTTKSYDINECFYLYYKHNQGRTIKVLAEEMIQMYKEFRK